jgi:hypothetical protein
LQEELKQLEEQTQKQAETMDLKKKQVEILKKVSFLLNLLCTFTTALTLENPCQFALLLHLAAELRKSTDEEGEEGDGAGAGNGAGGGDVEMKDE